MRPEPVLPARQRTLPWLVLVLVVSLWPAGAVAAQEAGPVLRDPAPAAGALVAGTTTEVAISADGTGPLSATVIRVDGSDLAVTADGDGPRRLRATARLQPGSHVAEAMVTDAAGRTARRLWRFEVSPAATERLAGDDRFATAVAISVARFPQPASAPAVVLARADDFADALGGAPLAARLGAPLLPTGSGHLDATVRAELARVLRPGGQVVLLGGGSALGAAVESEVAALGFPVRRVSGEHRYATAAEVARELLAETATPAAAPTSGDATPTPAATAAQAGAAPVGRTAVLVSGADFPDALSASAPAAVRGWPILLTPPEALPAETARALAELGIQHLVVVGGEAAVPASVVAQARAAAPGLAAEGAVERHAGPTRYDTGAAVALALPGPDPSAVALASGTAFVDALAGAPLAAQRGETLLLTDRTLPEPTARRLLAAPPSGLTLLGGPAAVAEEAVRAAHAVLADRALPVTTDPAAGTELAALDVGSSVRIATDLTVDAGASQAQLEVDGREVALNLRAEGQALVAEVRELPADLAGAPATEQRHDVRLVAAVRQAGPGVDPVRHADVHFSLVRRPRAPLIRTAEGFDLVGGDGPVVGFGGPVRTYSLEVELGTGIDPLAFAQEAEAALSDPRSWTARGERRLQRVGSADAGIRVVLATPGTVDRFCAQAGLRTGGVYSCWNGRFAMINLDRWNGGSAAFAAPLAEYRGYVINHETGHGLGYHHVGCPAAGALAPVMMQQTISTGACRPNAWPYP